MAQTVKNLTAMQETRVRSLSQDNLLEKEMAAQSSVLAWRILMDRGAWQATVPKVTESDTTEGLTLPVPLGVYRPHEGHPQLQSRKDPLLQRNKLSSWAGA